MESVEGIEKVLRENSKEERQEHGEANISQEPLKKEMAKLRERFQTGNEKKRENTMVTSNGLPGGLQQWYNYCPS